ncbi:glycosyltransferase family 4 protein [Spirosoma jeollabukense]
MNKFRTSDNAKRKITWITPDYFIDCDLNKDILTNILQYFDINWIVLLPKKGARFTEKDFSVIKSLRGLNIDFLYWEHRARSPKMLLFYEKVYKRIKYFKSDIVYFNDVPTSPYILPLYWRLNKYKTILTAHDGNVKPSFKMAWISKVIFKLAFSTVNYVNMFSLSQSSVFSLAYPKPKVFVIPLALKNFGESTRSKRNDSIVFSFFGSINSNKNVELLIEAACNLYDKGICNFKISINGYCADWEIYESKIKYPHLFECDIRLLKNSDIPDLFSQSHYIVFPYKEVSQSGALKVAFNYCVPVIVSDLEAFTDEVKEGVNGFIFKSNSVAELENVMSERINNHVNDYKSVQTSMLQYNKENFSNDILAKKYLNMFNEVMSKS